MPLRPGGSKRVISENISEFHGGKTYNTTKAKFGKKKADAQAVAVAMSNARKYAGGGEVTPDMRKKAHRYLTLTKDADDFQTSNTMKSFPSLQDIQARKSLEISDAVRRTKGYAGGGQIRGPGPTFYQRDANRKLAQQGLIKSAIPGRTDKHKVRVPAGSYVLPADFVSHVGQNNTLAGDKFLRKRFGAGGGVAFARGGRAPDPVDIIVAGGEWLVHPESVAKIGGGDLKRGHDILDKEVLSARKNHIGTLSNLPGPKQG